MALAEQLIHLIHLGSLAGGIVAFVWYQEYYYHQKAEEQARRKAAEETRLKADGEDQLRAQEIAGRKAQEKCR